MVVVFAFPGIGPFHVSYQVSGHGFVHNTPILLHIPAISSDDLLSHLILVFSVFSLLFNLGQPARHWFC